MYSHSTFLDGNTTRIPLFEKNIKNGMDLPKKNIGLYIRVDIEKLGKK